MLAVFETNVIVTQEGERKVSCLGYFENKYMSYMDILIEQQIVDKVCPEFDALQVMSIALFSR